VWHHRRPSIKRYLKQQRGYAKAEALLAEKWPSKYNSVGHLTWHGRLYGKGRAEAVLLQPRIYHGTWGSALFQSVYEPAPGLFSSLPLMPEWYFLLLVLGTFTAFGLTWPPLFAVTPVLVAAFGLTIVQAMRGAANASFKPEPRSALARLRLRAVVALLHLLQPAARLLGRVQHGLGPWGRRAGAKAPPLPRLDSIWCENWAQPEARLSEIEAILVRKGCVVSRGGDFDRWDLAVRGSSFGSVRILSMVEEHGAGKQLFRLWARPHLPGLAIQFILVFVTAALFAAVDQVWVVAVPLAALASLIGHRAHVGVAVAMKRWADALAAYTSVAR
jgi:hypothetical protein